MTIPWATSCACVDDLIRSASPAKGERAVIKEGSRPQNMPIAAATERTSRPSS